MSSATENRHLPRELEVYRELIGRHAQRLEDAHGARAQADRRVAEAECDLENAQRRFGWVNP